MRHLTTPCATCPFRTDVTPFLRTGRCIELAAINESGTPFSCHKTVDYSDDEDLDEDGGHAAQGQEMHCAGALIVLAKQYPEEAPDLGLNMDAPVFGSFGEWIDANRTQNESERPKRVTHG